MIDRFVRVGRLMAITASALLFSQGLAALDNGLARTPPMGWNSWNCFKQYIDEQKIREIADAMVSSGMKDAGYRYIILDDVWMRRDRDASGNLVADPAKFPSGIKALADYIHSKGLLIGIYGDRGSATCSNIAGSGSYGHEEQDADLWASWGIDYLKYDNCNPVGTLREDYEKMGAALLKTGRPIVYSLCAWGFQGPWMLNAGHLWRSTGDIYDGWDNKGWWRKSWENGVTVIIDMNADLYKWAGPGHWNDPDMLEVGNGAMSNTEYVSHFSLWCIMAAPLIAGNDLRSMEQPAHDILTNAEAIAVDQDAAGIQGSRVRDEGDFEVWMKPLGAENGGEKAVVLFNRSADTATIKVDWREIGISGAATVRDLWAHKDLGTFTGAFSAGVESHGVVMVRIKAKG